MTFQTDARRRVQVGERGPNLGRGSLSATGLNWPRRPIAIWCMVAHIVRAPGNSSWLRQATEARPTFAIHPEQAPPSCVIPSLRAVATRCNASHFQGSGGGSHDAHAIHVP